MDEALFKGIEGILASIQREVILLDMQGRALLPKSIHSYYLPNDVNQRAPILLNGYWFLRAAEDSPWVLMTADQPGGEDILILAAQAVAAHMQLNPPGDDRLSAYTRLLTEEMPPAEQDALLRAFHIPAALPRCVLMLSLPGARGGSYHALRDLVPLSPEDQLLEINRQQVALIKALEEGEDAQDVEEFALAVQETAREETGLKLVVGVGDIAPTADSLLRSAREAARALEIGPQYLPMDSLFVWRRMLLPRFLSDIPPERAQHYHSLLFHRKTASLFTPEMLETVDMFLKKDLNVSDTARQLYIHRNTLVYRLDKVQRLTGLDVRRFDDAFVYRLLSQLKLSLKPKPQRGPT